MGECCKWESSIVVTMGPRKYTQSSTSDNASKPFKCTYDGCNFATVRNSNLQSHIRQKHTLERPYKCLICNKYEAATQGDVNKHIRRVHQKLKIFECPHCGEKFHKPDERDQHIVRKHTDKRDFPCELVGCKAKQAFKTEKELHRHQKFCLVIKDHKCKWDGCKKEFVTKAQLDDHVKRHKKQERI